MSAVDTSEVEERWKWSGTEKHAVTHPETAVAVAKPVAAPTGTAEEEEEHFCAAVWLAAAAAAVAKGKLCVGNRELDQKSWFSISRKRDRDVSYGERGCGEGGGEWRDEAEEGNTYNDLQGTIGLLEDALCRCVCFCVCDCVTALCVNTVC